MDDPSMQSILLKPYTELVCRYQVRYEAEKTSSLSSADDNEDTTPCQKLKHAADHLNQHEIDMKNKIRELGLCEKAHADPEAGTNSVLTTLEQEPSLSAFAMAARQPWNRTSSTKPTVKMGQNVKTAFNPGSISMDNYVNEYVGIARRTVARMDEYEKQITPLKRVVAQAIEAEDAAMFAGPFVPSQSDSATLPKDDQNEGEKASRDPRKRKLPL